MRLMINLPSVCRSKSEGAKKSGKENVRFDNTTTAQNKRIVDNQPHATLTSVAIAELSFPLETEAEIKDDGR